MIVCPSSAEVRSVSMPPRQCSTASSSSAMTGTSTSPRSSSGCIQAQAERAGKRLPCRPASWCSICWAHNRVDLGTPSRTAEPAQRVGKISRGATEGSCPASAGCEAAGRRREPSFGHPHGRCHSYSHSRYLPARPRWLSFRLVLPRESGYGAVVVRGTSSGARVTSLEGRFGSVMRSLSSASVLFAHFLSCVVDRGESDEVGLGDGGVVESDHRDRGGHGEPEGAGCGENTQGGRVVGGEDGARRASRGQEFEGGGVAVRSV